MEKKPTLIEIQALWKVPAIDHFFKIFNNVLDFKPFDVEDLEHALMNRKTEENSFLYDAILCLLGGCFSIKINHGNFMDHLKDAVEDWCNVENLQNPLKQSEFEELTVVDMVELMYILCHIWIENNDVTGLTKQMDCDVMKALCIGVDQSNAQYWFFHGTRLYKEVTAAKSSTGKKRLSARERKLKINTNQSEGKSNENAWEIICRNEQDWTQFADKMLKSEDKNEKNLGIEINKIFVASVKSAFNLKEKEYQRKLIEMTVKRESRRIAVKRQIDEELKSREAKEIEKKCQLEKVMKQKHKELKEKEEQERKAQEREKRILMRQKALEERATRVQNRKEGMKSNISSFEDSSETSDEDYSVKPRKRFVLRENMRKLLTDLMVQDDSWIFLDPIDEEFAPNYFNIIKNPICLKDMKEKLYNGSYTSFADMERDFNLLISNCNTYNGLKSECARMAANLHKAFRNSCRRYRLPMGCDSSALKNTDKTKQSSVQENISSRAAHNFSFNTSDKSEDRRMKEIGIDLPENLNGINGKENVDSECSSHFSSSGESSSDYDTFSSIISKRPNLKRNHSSDLKQLVSNSSPSYTPTTQENIGKAEISKPTDIVKMKKETPTWSYRATCNSKPFSNVAEMNHSVDAPNESPSIRPNLNGESDIIKVGSFKAQPGFSYAVKSVCKNENGILTLKLFQKQINTANSADAS